MHILRKIFTRWFYKRGYTLSNHPAWLDPIMGLYSPSYYTFFLMQDQVNCFVKGLTMLKYYKEDIPEDWVLGHTKFDDNDTMAIIEVKGEKDGKNS